MMKPPRRRLPEYLTVILEIPLSEIEWHSREESKVMSARAHQRWWNSLPEATRKRLGPYRAKKEN